MFGYLKHSFFIITILSTLVFSCEDGGYLLRRMEVIQDGNTNVAGFFSHGYKYLFDDGVLLYADNSGSSNKFIGINLINKERKNIIIFPFQATDIICQNGQGLLVHSEGNNIFFSSGQLFGTKERESGKQAIFYMNRTEKAGDILVMMDTSSFVTRLIELPISSGDGQRLISSDGYLLFGEPDSYINKFVDEICIRFPGYEQTNFLQFMLNDKLDTILETKGATIPAYSGNQLKDGNYIGAILTSSDTDGAEDYYPAIFSRYGKMIKAFPEIVMHDGPYLSSNESRPYLINNSNDLFVTFKYAKGINGTNPMGSLEIAVYKLIYPKGL